MTVIANLNFRSGENIGKIYPIEKDEVIIGRENICDLIIDDIEVSRRHAKITISNGQYYLRDLQTTNGTLINGRKINKIELLKNGDIITFGEKNIIEITLEIKNDIREDGYQDVSVNPQKPEIDDLLVTPDTSIPERMILAHQESNLIDRIKNLPGWALVLIFILVFIILFCLLPLLAIELTDQWCNLFSSFFNAISPGVCP